jgi:protein CpxP
MKLKNLSLITAAIVLSLAATPLAVKAETSAQPLIMAQAQEGYNGLEALGLSEEQIEELKLSSDQKAQIAEIHKETNEKIKAVLTPQQREQLEAAKLEGIPLRDALRSLNLTVEQRKEVRQIQNETQAQINTILTPEQQQKLEQLRQNKPQRQRRRRLIR